MNMGIQEEWTTENKVLFLVKCCTAAALFAAIPEGHISNDDFCAHWKYTDLFQIEVPPTSYVGLALLVVVSCLSGRLSIRGKQSTSYAVLAYGALMVIPCLMLFCMFWYAAGADRGAWIWYIGALVSALVLIQGGMRAAFHDRWDRVLFWWRLSFAWVIFFVPMWFGARHGAEERYLDRIHESTEHLSPTPTWTERL